MSDEGEPKRPNAIVAIALAVVAAACLVYAAFTHAWLVNDNPGEQIVFGLRDNSQCTGSDCVHRTNSELIKELRDFSEASARDASVAFAPFGWITLVASLLATLGLVGAAGIAANGKKPDLPMTPATLALLGIMVGLISGCVFVATKPGPSGYVGVGLSFWGFGAGCVLGIAAAQLLAKVNRPLDPDLMADAMNADEF
jgi:glycine/D-amino acid oxidase-like deaminating enzyme